MKKIISILLVAVMMLSFTVTGFAARESVELGKTCTVTVKNETIEYSFFVPESGVYSIEFELLSKVDGVAVSVSLETFDNYLGSGVLYYIDGLGEALTDGTHFIAEKNQEIRITVSNSLTDSFEGFESLIREATISFVIKKADNLPELKMGETYSFDGYDQYYILRPTQDGIYNIWSHSFGSVSVEGFDGYIDGSPFWVYDCTDFSFEVTAGEIYLINVCNDFYSDDEPETFTFSVADGSKILPEVIEIDEITVVKGDFYCFDVSVLPYGSFYNYDELVFELENGKIADIEYDKDMQMITVQGNKLGKTTLKVTEPISGVTAETTVRVVSPLRMFFIELFEYIADIFGMIFAK